MLSHTDISGIKRIVSIDFETTGNATKTHSEVAKLPKGLRLPGVIIQVGCVELLRDGESWIEGAKWETLVNPDGSIHPASLKIHGIHPSKLKNAPRFPDIRKEFEDFAGDSIFLAHAAKNEIDYLNYEMRRAKFVDWQDEPYHEGRFLDTQVISRSVFPGAPASLDALCNRLWIYPSDRDKHHGALLDAELTAEAFIKMTTGFVTDKVRMLSF